MRDTTTTTTATASNAEHAEYAEYDNGGPQIDGNVNIPLFSAPFRPAAW